MISMFPLIRSLASKRLEAIEIIQVNLTYYKLK